MTDRIPLDHLTSDALDQLYDDLDRYEEVQGEMNERAIDHARQLAALRQVARGYCPACGRGDAAPTVEDWEQQKQRADQVEELLRIAHDTSNRSETERAQAVQRAERAETEAARLRGLRAVAGIHFRAIGHHLNDAGIRLPDHVVKLCQLLDDELTLTLDALAEQHPASLAAPAPAPSRACLIARDGGFPCLQFDHCATCDDRTTATQTTDTTKEQP
jgi:hypothetical protein